MKIVFYDIKKSSHKIVRELLGKTEIRLAIPKKYLSKETDKKTTELFFPVTCSATYCLSVFSLFVVLGMVFIVVFNLTF